MKHIYFTQSTQQRAEFFSSFLNDWQKQGQMNVNKDTLFLIHWPVYHSDYGDAQSALEIILTAKALFHNANKKQIHLICPYFPFTIFSKPDTCVELSALIFALKNIKVKQISVLDVHDPLLFEDICTSLDVLFKNGFPNYPLDILLNMPQFGEKGDREDMIVVAPDKGSINRAGRIAKYLGVSLVCFQKYRLPHTVNVKLETSDTVIGKRAIVVDDFILTGKTITAICDSLSIKGCTDILPLITHNLQEKSHCENFTPPVFCINDMYGPHSKEASMTKWMLDMIDYEGK